MALDNPLSNKMIQTPPAKKGFHFAATVEHLAEFIEAETIQEAEAIYQKIKRAVGGTVEISDASEPAPSTAPEQSTGAIDEEIKA
jgi:hypothetical protein